MSILLLEDLAEIRVWLSQLLARLFPQAQVMACARCDQALRCIGQHRFDLALVDLGLPDGSGLAVVEHLRQANTVTQTVVVTIYDDDEHLFPALQAGAFGYILKEQNREQIEQQLQRIRQGEPPLSPSIARRLISHFKQARKPASADWPQMALTERETDVLLRVAKGFTLPEIAVQLSLSRYTIADYVKQIYRKLNISSRAEAALEAQRLGLFRS
ncbi:MAG: response regulator transcription factor [Betaproteobacteria bacterium]|nr:response regulator transcription factor [Betaproteobacteria bacterium]